MWKIHFARVRVVPKPISNTHSSSSCRRLMCTGTRCLIFAFFVIVVAIHFTVVYFIWKVVRSERFFFFSLFERCCCFFYFVSLLLCEW